MHRSGFRPFLFWKISKGKSHSEVSANFNGHLDFAQFLNQSKDTAYVILNRKDQIEYIEFLKRTDLGSQYPKERFEKRIAKLVDHVSISLVARNEDNQIVGVLFGLTDYAYWLYITDLGVDRDYLHQGIGTELIKTAHSLAGGKNDIAVYLVANENAIAFYEKLGMKKANDVMEYDHIEWTAFTVE